MIPMHRLLTPKSILERIPPAFSIHGTHTTHFRSSLACLHAVGALSGVSSRLAWLFAGMKLACIKAQLIAAEEAAFAAMVCWWADMAAAAAALAKESMRGAPGDPGEPHGTDNSEDCGSRSPGAPSGVQGGDGVAGDSSGPGNGTFIGSHVVGI